MLKLTYSQSSTRDGLYAYCLHIKAEPLLAETEDGSLSNPNIFVFRRSTPTMNPFGNTDMEVDDEFFNIATPVDMYDVPEKQPDIEKGMPYFRDSELDLWFRNMEDMERARSEIDGDVASLVTLWDNISATDKFEHTETVHYG